MARRERQELVAAMRAAGPDAPTLCGSWTVRALAAHLIVRERRPDAAPGILLRPFAGRLESVQAKTAAKPFDELLELVRTGPPWWSPLKPVDAVANLSEMFVHHEDVRRAEPGWQPRTLDPSDEDRLWKVLARMGRMAYRKSPVPLTLATPDGRSVSVISGDGGDGAGVTLTGAPSELLLHAFGREQVRIETAGPQDAVRAVLDLDRSL